MKKGLMIILAILTMSLALGCSSDDDPVVAPPADIIEAHADVANFLVADGTVDTRLTVKLGTSITVAENVSPNGMSLDGSLILGSDTETAPLAISLTHGDGSTLNPGEEFLLVKERRYLLLACGMYGVMSGQTKPTLLQLTPMAKPGVGKVHFRFIHAMPGHTDPVDVHVNGEVISNVAYGSASNPVTFAARPVGQDDLRVVPVGVIPDGTNEIWMSTGHLLFFMDEHFDGVLAHHPKSAFDGDVNGDPVVVLFQSPYK